MTKKENNNKIAVIVLHEIYGVNKFIEDICAEYHMQGVDIFCPEILQESCFQYSEATEAYNYFINEIGFDYYSEIEQLLEKLKLTYNKVFIIGFSVGATIAWRCCENKKCDGIICCYGSRIRDYLQVQPSCPVLLLFAGQDSFDVDNVIVQLMEKSNVEIYKLQASHGFMDRYSDYFNEEQAQTSKKYINNFLKRYTEID
ncbi:MAG: hydrolase [Clostridiales bacterium]|nr:hydrolase [Clostridiales bacterium]